jgi:hypothetical protein
MQYPVGQPDMAKASFFICFYHFFDVQLPEPLHIEPNSVNLNISIHTPGRYPNNWPIGIYVNQDRER